MPARQPRGEPTRAEVEALRQALEESEARYRDLFESSIDLIYEHDLKGNFTSINRATERVTGYSRDEIPGRSIAEILEPEHLERARTMIARKLADPELTTYYEIGIRAKDGRSVLLEVSTRVLRRDGKPLAIQGVARDITERKQAERALAELARIKTAKAELGDRMRREHDPEKLAETVLDFLAAQLGVAVAALHLRDPDDGSFRPAAVRGFAAGLVPESERVEQVAATGRRRQLSPAANAPPGEPGYRLLQPFATRGAVKAVAEFRTVGRLGEDALTFLNEVDESVALTFEAAQARDRMQRLLTELRATNEALAERTRSLEEAQRLLEERAEALSLSNRYKTEFLANMSHELRTPLNSMLLLAQVLERNAEGNLSTRQVEYARTIKRGGDDLLELINDVLDLAKVEAGRADVRTDDIDLRECAAYVEESFRALAQDKKLAFSVEVADDAPARIVSDERRLKQILRNLLSNAFKFTETGSVQVRIERPRASELSGLAFAPDAGVAIRVEDTGIGIAPHQQKIIFEAFLQADGSTSREYGGTGLGLAISREFSQLLGGAIRIESELGRGSCFSLHLPERLAPRVPAAAHIMERVPDDSAQLGKGERAVLVVEDDASFARTLLEFSRNQGFKGLVAVSGEEGLERARRFRPSAIVLDIGLPGMDGWQLLAALRAEPETAGIPVHVISGRDEAREALARGAIGFSTKPVHHDELVEVFRGIQRTLEAQRKRLLVVEDDEVESATLRRILGREGWEVTFADSGAKARSALSSERFDGVVLDLSLPDVKGLELLEEIQGSDPAPPKVVVHTGMSLSRAEASRIDGLSEGTVMKGTDSSERLLEEVRLFLRDVEADIPGARAQRRRGASGLDRDLIGARVLAVDDDPRGLAAVTRALEGAGMHVTVAESGVECLERLAGDPDVDVVLLDMMMPGMDGYETVRRIRAQPRFAGLPVVALTARALAGDEERCREVGVDDYLSKPVDLDRLVSVIRTRARRSESGGN